MTMTWLQIVRLSVLSFTIFCAILVASLSAHVTAFAVENFGVYYNFAALGIATGVLTMITLPVMLIIDFLRKGAFTSMIVVELSWLGILWVLWLATAALTVDQTAGVFTTCSFPGYPILTQLCHETQAIEAFSFLAWLSLLGYIVLLLVVALVNATRGAPVWKSSVRANGGFVPSPASNGASTGAPQQMTTMQMQQQQQLQQPLMGAMPSPQVQPVQGQGYQPEQIYHGAPQGGAPSHVSQPSSGYNSYPQV